MSLKMHTNAQIVLVIVLALGFFFAAIGPVAVVSADNQSSNSPSVTETSGAMSHRQPLKGIRTTGDIVNHVFSLAPITVSTPVATSFIVTCVSPLINPGFENPPFTNWQLGFAENVVAVALPVNSGFWALKAPTFDATFNNPYFYQKIRMPDVVTSTTAIQLSLYKFVDQLVDGSDPHDQFNVVIATTPSISPGNIVAATTSPVAAGDEAPVWTQLVRNLVPVPGVNLADYSGQELYLYFYNNTNANSGSCPPISSACGVTAFYFDDINLDICTVLPAPIYAISGRVVDSSGVPLAGVTLSVGGQTATTDGQGTYVISSLTAGSYTLTASKEGYTFNPASRSINLPPNATGQDFIGVPSNPDTRFVDVTISLYKAVSTQAERTAYENIIGYFADGVYELSNGRHKIRNVTIYQNGGAAQTANILWNASEWPRAYVAAYGRAGYPVIMGDVFPFPTPYDALLAGNQKGAGYTLAHEWGHHYYGLYDEYKGSDPNRNSCTFCPHTDDSPVPYSAMNSQWNATGGNFAWLNFSVPKYDTAKTAQYRVYAASGWETLARAPQFDPRDGQRSSLPKRPFYPELVAVAPGANQDAAIDLPDNQARSHLSLNWSLASQKILANSSAFQAAVDSLTGQEVAFPKPVVLIAHVSKTDPIAKANLVTQATAPDGNGLPLTLKDDGLSPDFLSNDGLYSGLLPYDQNGIYQVVVTFTNSASSTEFTQISYNHSPGPNGETPSLVPQPVGQDFTAVATTTIIVTDFAADDHSNSTSGATLVPTNNVDVPGRIDSAGDVDVFRVDTAGAHILRITDLALDMQAVIRLLDASGSETDRFTPPVGDSSYFYTPLTITTGQPVYVSLTHADSNAASGLYNISAGPALSVEAVTLDGNDIYLPVIIK